MFDSKLFERVLIEPAKKGADKLEIVSGYATAGLAKQHLQKLQEQELNPHIRLTVGMAMQGISLTQHKGFIKLTDRSPIFSCNYWGKPPMVHAKVYAWLKNGNPFIAFTGSANYTHNGFGREQKEILTEVDAKIAVNWCNMISNDSYFCNDPEIEATIPIREEHRTPPVNLERHSLPLYMKNTQEVHNKAGLNWGQRPGREPNQAYIPIPSNLQYQNSNFFPPIASPFTVLTDDGLSMILVVAQQNGKALESTENNSELGLYFRQRLGLQSGEYVRYEHLEEYGRLEVEFIKIDEETFFMDFSAE